MRWFPQRIAFERSTRGGALRAGQQAQNKCQVAWCRGQAWVMLCAAGGSEHLTDAPPSPPALLPWQVQVLFQFAHPGWEVPKGPEEYELRIVGSSPSLGGWDPLKAPALHGARTVNPAEAQTALTGRSTTG